MLPRFARPLWLSIALLLPTWWLAAGAAAIAPRRSGAPFISEVAWGGTLASANDEWIELYNPTAAAIDLTGWQLTAADGTPAIALTGSLPAGGFWLLERGDDAVADVPADALFSGALLNSGETLWLRDAAGTPIDSANQNGGGWPAGSGSPDYRSMERRTPGAPDDDDGWLTHADTPHNGIDAGGNPIGGTPRQPNRSWQTPPPDDRPDLALTLRGPAAVLPGVPFAYTLALANRGALTATGVLVTDTLPIGAAYVGDSAPFGGSTAGGRRVWQVGQLAPGIALTWHLTLTTAADASGSLTNHAIASSDAADADSANNSASLTTALAERALLINELLADPGGDANGDGSVSSFDDEFVELVNNSGDDLLLAGWALYDGGNSAPRHLFSAGSYLPAGCALVIFGGPPRGTFGRALVQSASAGTLSLNNSGDTLRLTDDAGNVRLTLSYGNEAGHDESLTRSPDVLGALPLVRHAAAAGADGRPFSPGTRVDGAPFGDDCQRADLAVALYGPAVAQGDTLALRLSARNVGGSPAPGVLLTATLPTAFSWLADDSGLPLSRPTAATLVWAAGDLAAGDGVTFTLTVAVTAQTHGSATTQLRATTTAAEFVPGNNQAQHTTLVGDVVLINALLPAPYPFASEAIQLINVGPDTIDVAGWQVGSLTRRVALPPTVLPAGGTLWLAEEAPGFTRYFGFAPAFDRVALGGWPGFANAGGAALLYHADGTLIDTLVYEDGPPTTAGWHGDALRAYAGGGLAKTGQILYRQRDQHNGRPLPDSDRAADWAQALDDPVAGRRVRYPGWDEGALFHTYRITTSATLTVAIAPDNTYRTVAGLIDGARHTLRLNSLTLTNWALAQRLAAAARRGVAVDILLEGAPPGGLPDQSRAACQLIEAAGGRCWFMINEPDLLAAYDRYDYLHAKYMLIDDRLALIGSDNFSATSMPYDDPADGTAGRRGALLVTDAAGIVARLGAIWAADLAPAAHADILRWTPNHPLLGNRYGAPPVGFIPDEASGGISYTMRYPQPTTLRGTFALELLSAPESSLRSVDSLLGLIARVGAGDTLLVQQLTEPLHWGGRDGSIASSPNPRLQAYIAAAQRGATVRLMLDRYIDELYFSDDEPDANRQTCLYLDDLARRTGLRLACQLGNPTGLGIHNKLVLAQIDGRGYVHIGSLNGSEQAHKANREVALQVQSDGAYALLAAMFNGDWQNVVWLPFVGRSAVGRADRLLISEVYYDPPGTADEAEFIEIVNPTAQTVDISGYSLGDAVNWDDFEDARRFPPGTLLPSAGVIVVAYSAQPFFDAFGRWPDFEIADSAPHVAQMLDHPLIGDPEAQLRLGNPGDEVLLRDAADRPIDVVTYGVGIYPGVTAALPVSSAGRSLTRVPYYHDTNDGLRDFREALPAPGSVVP